MWRVILCTGLLCFAVLGVPLGGWAHTVENLLGLRTLSVPTVGEERVVYVLSHTNPDDTFDHGGGWFRWVSTELRPDDNGMVIRPGSVASDHAGRWVRHQEEPGVVSVLWFGATGGGRSDDFDAIQSALGYVAANGGTVRLPQGEYRVSRPLVVIPGWDLEIVGAGPGATSLVAGAEGDMDTLLTIEGRKHTLFLRGIQLHGNSRTNTVLHFLGNFSHLSHVEHLLITGARDVGMRIEGQFISAGFDNISIVGGKVGILCPDTIALSGAHFERLRISNTREAALSLRNPL